MIHVPGPYPPALYKDSGKLFAVAGRSPMEVPKGTCLRDLHSDYKRSQQRLPFNNPQAWKVTGSTGTLYIVERNMLGSYGCTCLGFNFRKKCSHIDKIKAKVA